MFIVPRLFEEKRRDIVFGFPSFRPSVCPSVRPSVPLKYYVPCVRISSYSFLPILSKLYRCFFHGLKICMWFGYYPEIIFCHFFCNLNLVIFRCFSIKVNRWWVPCVRISSYSFISILLKLHRCFGHGLNICMWFGYNPQIIFYHFFRKLNSVIFQAFLPLK